MGKAKRIAITGIGVVSPFGTGKEKFWRGIREGRSAIRQVTGFNTAGFKCKRAAEIRNFSLSRLSGMKGLRQLSRSTQFALVAAKMALDDAGLEYPVAESKTDSYGVAFGISTGSTRDFLEFHKDILVEGPRFVDPLAFPNASPNASASHISIKFNIKGFNATITSCSSSGLDVMDYGRNAINNYGYKVVLAGGAEELTREMYLGLIKVNCLAGSQARNSREVSCPYDKKRCGIIASEGAAIFVLEDLENARKRGAKIYAEIKGYGFAFDSKTERGFSRNAEGAASAMDQALSEFGYPANRIDYIAGSANSTRGADHTEAKAIRAVFGESRREVPVSAVKSMIGEPFSAGGVLNAAAAMGAIKGRFIPPTVNYKRPDKMCDVNITANKPLNVKVNNVLVNSFSHNGFNSSLVIGREDV